MRFAAVRTPQLQPEQAAEREPQRGGDHVASEEVAHPPALGGAPDFLTLEPLCQLYRQLAAPADKRTDGLSGGNALGMTTSAGRSGSRWPKGVRVRRHQVRTMRPGSMNKAT
jgi:hypothetical protein